ncbi:osmoprotectant NAGGN system M42 family peptidase [Pseudovibrio sp. SPO723]|uniref:osmoprotectant NAGGN system M42 family peptidase n=1 Tax=Nesiotobacter zosterae TaxID=392721 RepID=UPI0029C1C0F3|nr:osmoprotectant NAGGN system M42 family peptidase [Pseudovibrio sp. SPO723]MDX5594228.1 osmoprotectant NAGGN system M42 family peptidase [Pseudovibrio sp. SPO723]
MTNLPVIDLEYLAATLKDLLHLQSPTGYTDEIAHRVGKELDRLGIPYQLTRRGAIRARIKGQASKPARAMVSHLDTLGAQVKSLKENGRLELVPIGHWSARFAEGGRVTLFSERGSYTGTVLPLRASGHTYNDGVDTMPIGWDYVELRVDAYANTASDLEKLGIEIGDFVAFDAQPEFLENGYIVSRHLDNKAGVALMLAAMKALVECDRKPTVDVYWLFTIAEEIGHGATSILTPEIASMVAIDNGTTAPGQNSAEFGVTISMADQTGPFDYHLTQKLVHLCKEHNIKVRKDIFRYYRSDAASAVEAGADVRTALATFGVDASHGYERIHMHALRSLAELCVSYALSPVEIARDAREFASIKGFTHQPTGEADQELVPEVNEPDKLAADAQS